jgi:hypothetical protein
MFKKYLISTCVFLVCLPGASTWLGAVEVTNLYFVERPIAEQSKKALWNATLLGFKEVLIRKSGSRDILQSYEVQNAYSRVTAFLQRSQYSSQTDPSSELPYKIALHFEPRLIDNLIQDSKMTVWGTNRPVTMLWLAVEDENGRNVVNENVETSAIEQTIMVNSVRRGVPVILPLMDLEDEMLVSLSDVWGRFPSTIQQASIRYDADSIIFGRIRQQGEIWAGQFGYINNLEQSSFDVTAQTKEDVLVQMTDLLADTLCAKYCVVEQEGLKKEVLLQLSDVSSFSQFKSAESYLSNLSSIRRVELVSIDNRQANFKLTLLGQLDSVIEGISLNQKMVPVIKESEQQETDSPVEGQIAEGGSLTPDAESLETSIDNSDTLNGDEDSVTDSELLSMEDEDEDVQELEPEKIIEILFYRWIG